MGVLWLIVFAVAIWYAAKGSYNGVRGAYRRRRDAWAADHPNANGAAKRAAAVGNMAALLTYGGPALYRGWREGWRDGWGSGKQWAAQHRPAKPEPQPEPEPEPVATMARPQPQPHRDADGDLRFGDDQHDPNGVRDCLWCGGTGVLDGKPCGWCRGRQEQRNADWETRNPERPHLRAVPTHNPKEQDMAVETATGGEVTNAETNLVEANAAVREYSADFEDASADAQRAKEDLARVETWHASMGRSRAPQARVGEVAALIEPAQARLSAAQARQRAAEGSLAAAKAVQASAARDVELMGQAVGSWYGN